MLHAIMAALCLFAFTAEAMTTRNYLWMATLAIMGLANLYLALL
jgi:hypothetical protein